MGSVNHLLLGIGNILMQDEGVGVSLVNYIAEKKMLPQNIDIVDGGTGGMHLLEYFEHYSKIYLVDSTIDGKPKGTLTILHPKFSSDYPKTLTAHDIGLKDLLDITYLRNTSPDVTLFTISISEDIPSGVGLSEELDRLVPELAEKIVSVILSEWGQ
ncbi:MAG: HyaD/HybD family hydrogenase maturation endopeptidase [Calditrichia bacterium]